MQVALRKAKLLLKLSFRKDPSAQTDFGKTCALRMCVQCVQLLSCSPAKRKVRRRSTRFSGCGLQDLRHCHGHPCYDRKAAGIAFRCPPVESWGYNAHERCSTSPKGNQQEMDVVQCSRTPLFSSLAGTQNWLTCPTRSDLFALTRSWNRGYLSAHLPLRNQPELVSGIVGYASLAFIFFFCRFL